ncbi:MAG: helix-turn-helix transcriptional regulator [Clostridia bacterium]|nr:helix-turn-helix transcriptional regulator [Clostridia bacterium]
MGQISCEIKSLDKTFHYSRRKDPSPTNIKYMLHNHPYYEILIFLKGNADFYVEGSVYPLKPMDILVMRDDEMHKVVNTSQDTYERIVIYLEKSFFQSEEMKQYENIFLSKGKGEKNLIERENVKKAEIFDTLLRIEKYIKQNNQGNEHLIRCILTEFLHQLKELGTSVGTTPNQMVKAIMDYINDHYNEDLSLDCLAERFYVSKYHLCRCFKQYAGLTINHYITCRRLMHVRKLHSQGKTLAVASTEAGFTSYSNFYKAYVRETGYSPSEGLSGQQKDD